MLPAELLRKRRFATIGRKREGSSTSNGESLSHSSLLLLSDASLMSRWDVIFIETFLSAEIFLALIDLLSRFIIFGESGFSAVRLYGCRDLSISRSFSLRRLTFWLWLYLAVTIWFALGESFDLKCEIVGREIFRVAFYLWCWCDDGEKSADSFDDRCRRKWTRNTFGMRFSPVNLIFNRFDFARIFPLSWFGFIL